MPAMKVYRDVVISLLLGAGIWFAIAFGAVVLGDAMGGFRYGETLILPDSYLVTDNRGGIGAVAAIAFLVAGALYAWLLLGHFSPAGPRLVGGLFLSAGVWAACGPATYDRILGQPPAWGYTIVLAAPLLISVERPPALGRSGPACVLVGALVWILIGAGNRLYVDGVGVGPMGESLMLPYERGRPGELWTAIGGVVVLLAAGVLAALLLRGSPVGVGLVGLGYTGLSIWALTEVFAVADWAPLVAAPLWGYALMLAVPMVAALRTSRRVQHDQAGYPGSVTSLGSDAVSRVVGPLVDGPRMCHLYVNTTSIKRGVSRNP
jgi:hypothetical protein